MSLVVASDIVMNFLSDLRSSWPESYPFMICCGDFFEMCIKSFSFSLQGFKKRAILVFSGAKSGGWGKNWKQALTKGTKQQEPVYEEEQNLKPTNTAPSNNPQEYVVVYIET